MNFKKIASLSLLVVGTACASITSVPDQSIAIGTTTPTLIDLDGDGTNDVGVLNNGEIHAYRQGLHSGVSPYGASSWPWSWSWGNDSLTLSLSTIYDNNYFGVRFRIAGVDQVGWVKVASDGLSVIAWAYQPASDGYMKAGMLTDVQSPAFWTARLQNFSLISGSTYGAKVAFLVDAAATVCYFVSSDATVLSDTATFNKFPHSCVAVSGGSVKTFEPVGISTFSPGSSYYLHYYAYDAAKNLASPRVSDIMNVDVTAPTLVANSDYVANLGPKKQIRIASKYDEINYTYYAVFPKTVSASTISADSIVNGTGAIVNGFGYQYGTEYGVSSYVSGLSDGSYLVGIVAEDKAGNRSVVTSHWVQVDGTAPALRELSLTSDYNLTGLSDENGTIYAKLRLATEDAVTDSTTLPVNSVFYWNVNADFRFARDICQNNNSTQICEDGVEYALDFAVVDNSGAVSSYHDDDNWSKVYTVTFTYDAAAAVNPDTLYLDINPTGNGFTTTFEETQHNVITYMAVVPAGTAMGDTASIKTAIEAGDYIADTTISAPNAYNKVNWMLASGLESETAYDFYLLLYGQNGKIRLIKSSFTTLDITASTLSTPKISAIKESGAKLTVQSSETGSVYYLVQATKDAAPDSIDVVAGDKSIEVAAATDTTKALSGLKAGTAYTVYVVAVDEAGNLSSVSSVAFTTLKTTGIVEVPVLSANSPIAYRVISLLGQIVKVGELQPGENARDIRGLSRGNYVVQLRQGSVRKVQQILVVD